MGFGVSNKWLRSSWKNFGTTKHHPMKMGTFGVEEIMEPCYPSQKKKQRRSPTSHLKSKGHFESPGRSNLFWGATGTHSPQRKKVIKTHLFVVRDHFLSGWSGLKTIQNKQNRPIIGKMVGVPWDGGPLSCLTPPKKEPFF